MTRNDFISRLTKLIHEYEDSGEDVSCEIVFWDLDKKYYFDGNEFVEVTPSEEEL